MVLRSTEPSDRRRVAVLGLGYVGLPVAETCARAGHSVVGIDTDAGRVQVVSELGLEGLRLSSSPESLQDCHVVFICVPTPREATLARHDAVRACAAAFALHGSPDALVILESTIRPGFVEELRPCLGHGGQVALAYAPERVDPQPAGPRGLTETPRLVAGVDLESAMRARVLLEDLGIPVVPVSLAVAERAKLLENTYRLVNVALANEFAELCRADGVDPALVVQAAGTKPFGFEAFYPGPGAGGHCVPVDPEFVVDHAVRRAVSMPLLRTALQANRRRPGTIADRVLDAVPPGQALLAVGLTYKPGVPDLRESPALQVCTQLSGRRPLLVHDPLIQPPPPFQGVSLEEGLARVDSVLLLVPQSPLVHERLARFRGLVLDATHSLLSAEQV